MKKSQRAGASLEGKILKEGENTPNCLRAQKKRDFNLSLPDAPGLTTFKIRGGFLL
jgi:hypothetical protein